MANAIARREAQARIGDAERPRKRVRFNTAEVMMRRGMEPVLVKGGGTVKALSAEFLDDLQVHWRKNRDQILDDVAKKYPAQYFAGMVALARIIRWEVGAAGEFERPRSPEEIIQKLEERVGPEGRKIFERFLEQVSRLQEKQRLAIMGEEAEEAEVGEDEADAESDIGS
jgi:hypothetical protein